MLPNSSPTLNTHTITNTMYMNTTKQINFGSYGGYICNSYNGMSGYFAIAGGTDVGGNPIDIMFFFID